MKVCYKCREEKSLDQFFNSKLSKDGKTKLCKNCHKIRTTEYKKNNPGRSSLWAHKHGLKMRYGIEYEVYENKLNEQDFRCAICGSYKYDKLNRRLSLDHNHNTGKIRGLLCSTCNRGLGNMKDSIQILENAINYLKKYE